MTEQLDPKSATLEVTPEGVRAKEMKPEHFPGITSDWQVFIVNYGDDYKGRYTCEAKLDEDGDVRTRNFRYTPAVSPSIICDGCNVTAPFEHRCHGSRSMVRGEQTGLPCECPMCKEMES